MSILTKQAKEFQANFTLYAVGFAAWIIGALVLVGITRRASGGETAGTLESCSCLPSPACCCRTFITHG